MKTITQAKANTLKTNFDSSEMNTSVYTEYKHPSYYKVRAEQHIKNEMSKLNGYDYRVTSANCHRFSCAYCTMLSGENEYIVYHTADYEYLVNYTGEQVKKYALVYSCSQYTELVQFFDSKQAALKMFDFGKCIKGSENGDNKYYLFETNANSYDDAQILVNNGVWLGNVLDYFYTCE